MSVSPASLSGSRILLRRLREIMEAGGSTQERLDRLVTMIASTMVADVCSIYLKRGRVNELFATEGLKREAVHATRMKEGEGLVGVVAETGRPLNLADAQKHPSFSYRPETGEDPFSAFLGVPIVRSERVFGVLVVQNRAARHYGEDEVEALQLIAQVLAEMVAANAFGDLSELKEVEIKPSRPERLTGRVFSEGLSIGIAVLHEPHTPLGRLVADDPIKEEKRLDAALKIVRGRIASLLDGDGVRITEVSRDVLETFQMLANDAGWESRLKSGVRAGLSADAAVERVRGEHRARLNAAKDAILREQLHDLEDLDNRLLRALAGGDAAGPALPDNSVLIARTMGPAELLEYDFDKLVGVAMEEGSSAGHAAIVARAAGLPMVGRLPGLLSRIEAGDAIVLDAEIGEARLRPEPEVVRAYMQRVQLRSARKEEYAR
ncbi:MAG: GAF domain-containing protein [Hyphomonadaceae bacterium]